MVMEILIFDEGIDKASQGSDGLREHGCPGRTFDTPLQRDDEENVQPDVAYDT